MSIQNERLSRAKNAIDIIAGLKYNWNQNGAPAIPADIVARARSVLSKLTHIPAITPTAIPWIQFDFEENEAGYIEFEFLGDEVTKMFFVSKNNKRYIECRLTDDAVTDMVDRFYQCEL